jgi:hypothetical protein
MTAKYPKKKQAHFIAATVVDRIGVLHFYSFVKYISQ